MTIKPCLKNGTRNTDFTRAESVWSYKAARADKSDINIDVFARASKNDYSLIGEVKNRKKPFSVDEAEGFLQKGQALQELEQIEKTVMFVFSRSGFTRDTLTYFQEHYIAWSDDERWLGQETIVD